MVDRRQVLAIGQLFGVAGFSMAEFIDHELELIDAEQLERAIEEYPETWEGILDA